MRAESLSWLLEQEAKVFTTVRHGEGQSELDVIVSKSRNIACSYSELPLQLYVTTCKTALLLCLYLYEIQTSLTKLV